MAEGQRQGAESRQSTPEAVGNDDIDIQLEQPDTGDDLDVSLEPDTQEQPSPAGTQEMDDDIFIEEPDPEIELDATGAAEADQEDGDSQTAAATPAQQTAPPTGAPTAPPASPPPPPSEPPEPPVETPEEEIEEVEEDETSVEEERDERRDNLQELIDDFAEISEDELQNYNEFRQLSNGEKVKNALKSFARRAVVYAAVGVGIGLLTQAAPAAIAVGIAGGLGGSTLGRGLVDAVKRFSGSEKKEQEIQGQVSQIQTDKIGNLIALARRVKSLENLPGQQGQNPETSEITTIEQAKRDFLEALIDFNDMESQSNREIAGLRKKLSRSQRGWGIAKTVVGAIGGVTGGIAASAELKAALADKVAEEGMQMTGGGLGEAAPNLPAGHLVHIHEGQVVFDYNPGDLPTIYGNIASSPELAQSFITDQATAELVNQGMHQAGEEISQEFVSKVSEVAAERTAAYIVGAVATAEATDAVLQATARNKGNRFVAGSSDFLREEAAEYRGDLQAEANARQNERFRSMFVDQNGQVPEGVPSIGEAIAIEGGFTLGSQEGEVTVNSGDHLQIMGVDQNGNVLATHVESGQLLAFQRDEFYRNIIEPRISNNEETDDVQEELEEEVVTDEEESSIEEENSLEKERDELKGTVQTVKIDKTIDDQKFVCTINGKPRRVTVFGRPSESIEAGLQAKIKILEVWGDDNEFVNADVERVFREAEFEENANTDIESEQKALPPAEEKDQKSLPPAPELKALPPAEFEKEEKLRDQAREALRPGAVWVLSEGDKGSMVAEKVAFPTDDIERIEINSGDKYILDNVTKQYRRDIFVFHRIDQPGAEDVMQAGPNDFLRKLSPEYIVDIKDRKEKEEARKILLEEYKKITEPIPQPRSENIPDDSPEPSAETAELDEGVKKSEGAVNSMQEVAKAEGAASAELGERKVAGIGELKSGDTIIVSKDVPANLTVTDADGNEKSLIRDFGFGKEFVYNGPAPEEVGVGLYEIERGGEKYYLYENELVGNFLTNKKIEAAEVVEPVVETPVEPRPEIASAETQKSLPPARVEPSPAEKIAEVVRNQQEQAKAASENYKIVRSDQSAENPSGEDIANNGDLGEERESLQSYDFEYGLDEDGTQKRVEIAPGQSWRLILKDGQVYDLGIEEITPTAEPGNLTIKFRGAEPETSSVKNWKKVFQGGEILRGKEN